MSLPTFRINLSQPRLSKASPSIDGHDCLYGLALLMQISPTHVLAQLNRRPSGVAVIDYEDGMDFFVFDSLEGLTRAQPQTGFRNEESTHPETGQRVMYVKYPSGGGFVPLGAKRSDGSEHPFAGTGFALSRVISVPLKEKDTQPERLAHAREHWEVAQLRFNGETLHIDKRETIDQDKLLPGDVTALKQPITCAIGDDDDLLLTMTCARPDELASSGVTRWQCGQHGWRPVNYEAVTPNDLSFEPSLVRDIDGSLLFSVRGYSRDVKKIPLWPKDLPTTADALQLYRRNESGQWQQTLCLPCVRSPSPVALNITADGRPYLAGNPLRRRHLDREGRLCNDSWMREDLFAWRLNDERDGLLPAVNLLDARKQFGLCREPSGPRPNFWYLDHPVGGSFRLSDGRWHSLIGFRVCEFDEVTTSAGPTDFTGYWLEEINDTEAGSEHPQWRF